MINRSKLKKKENKLEKKNERINAFFKWSFNYVILEENSAYIFTFFLN